MIQRMDPTEHFRQRAVAFHAVNHACARCHVSRTGAAWADECVGIQQKDQPVQTQRKCQLGKWRAEVNAVPAIDQIGRRQCADERNLQCNVDCGGQQNRANHCQWHVTARIDCLARHIDRRLETVVAEHDTAGGNCRHDGRPAVWGEPAWHRRRKVFAVEATVQQRDCGQCRDNQLECGDNGVCLRIQRHAPIVDQEVNNHQPCGKQQAKRGQFMIDVQSMRPLVGPCAHVLDRRFGFDRNHGNNRNPVRPCSDKTQHGSV